MQGLGGANPARRRAALNPAPGLGFTLVFDCAAAAARSVGVEGGARSGDWEGLERNLGWLKVGSQLPALSADLAPGNLSSTSKGTLFSSPKSAT